MFKGLKAQYHIDKLMQKRVECPFDAGMDLYLSRAEPLKSEALAGCHRFMMGTELHLVPAAGTFGLIHERSSSLILLNGGRVRSGIIDAGYTGELLVEITCPREAWEQVLTEIKTVQVKEIAVAQLIFVAIFAPVFQPLPPTTLPGRGDRGYGSTNPA